MKISVIIPTFNEASLVEQAVGNAWNCGADEVVLSDGGSTDQTVPLAAGLDCHIVHAPLGRGSQLNAGADAATGEVLLFLHADAVLSLDGCQQIREAMAEPVFAFGAFKQVLENRAWIYRLIEFGNACRGRVLQTVYGDQGIFVRKELFSRLGGFDEIPIMEDFTFSNKLRQLCEGSRKAGVIDSEFAQSAYKFRLLSGPLKVSTRRWEANGPIRQTFSNWMMTISFMRGTDPQLLAQVYYGKRRTSPHPTAKVAHGEYIDICELESLEENVVSQREPVHNASGNEQA